jgi:hypothetical protein
LKLPKTTLGILKATGLIAIPVALFILPKSYFNEGPSISVFAWFGAEDFMYSTGMTRAVMHLLHFDFETAAGFNKLSFIVLPILIIVWVKLLLKEFDVVILKWL